MIDSPRHSLVQAAASVWRSLARLILGRTGDRHKLPLSKLPEPFAGREASPGRRPALDRWENEGGASHHRAHANQLPPAQFRAP